MPARFDDENSGLLGLALGARHRWQVVLLALVVAAGLGQLVVHLREIPTRSTVRIDVRPSPADSTAVADVKLEATLLLGPTVLEDAVRRTGLPLDPTRLADQVDVEINARLHQLVVTVAAPTPAETAALTRAVAEAYIDQRVAAARAVDDHTIELLSTERDTLREQITVLGQEIYDNDREFRELVRVSPRTAAIAARLAEIEGHQGTISAEYGRALVRSSHLDTMVVDATAQRDSRVPSAAIAADPSPPAPTSSLSNPVLFLLVLGAGLAIGVVAAFVVWQRDGASDGSQRVTTLTGDAVLAEVPAAAARTDEAYARLHWAVLHHLHQVERRSIVVMPLTARLDALGATLGLATAAARSGRRTAVVSAAMSGMDVTARLGRPQGTGLSTALLEHKPLQLEAHPNDDRILIAGFGPRVDHARDLLDSPEMATLVHDLEDAFDLVVLQAPPYEAAADALALASLANPTVIVVDDHRRSLREARDAHRELVRRGVTVAGLVVVARR